MLARFYKVAKSTIVRHAKNGDWVGRRERFLNKRTKKILEINATTQAEAEERQLKHLRLIQNASLKVIYDIGMKTQSGDTSTRGVSNLSAASNTLFRAIMTERNILGLRTKPIVFRNPEDIEEYKVMMGIAEPPPADQKYNDMKAEVITLERMIERKEMLERMIKETNERGAY
jgi:hypothetical protein